MLVVNLREAPRARWQRTIRLRARRVAGWLYWREICSHGAGCGPSACRRGWNYCGIVARSVFIPQAFRSPRRQSAVATMPLAARAARVATAPHGGRVSPPAAWQGCDIGACEVGRDLRARRVAGWRHCRVLRELRAKNTRIHVAKLPRGSLGERALPALRDSHWPLAIRLGVLGILGILGALGMLGATGFRSSAGGAHAGRSQDSQYSQYSQRSQPHCSRRRQTAIQWLARQCSLPFYQFRPPAIPPRSAIAQCCRLLAATPPRKRGFMSFPALFTVFIILP